MAKSNASTHKLYLVEATVEKLVGDLTSFNDSGERQIIDYTTKDNDGFEDFEPGLGSFSIDLEGMVNMQPGTDIRGYVNFLAAFRSKTLLSFKIRNSTSGDLVKSGSGYVINIDETSPTEEALTFSATIKVKGDLTVGTVS